MSYYVHNIPGRLRVRSAQLKHHSCKATNLCTVLKTMDGVKTTELNQKSGSLIVYYDPNQLTADDILYLTHKAGCLDKIISHSAQSQSSSTKAGAIIGNAIFGTVVKKSLEASMFSLLKVAFR